MYDIADAFMCHALRLDAFRNITLLPGCCVLRIKLQINIHANLQRAHQCHWRRTQM